MNVKLLYEAHLYENKISITQDSELEQLSEFWDIELGIEEAIINSEFQLYYQPKLSLANDLVASVECLIRWIHPVHGFIPPDEFIGLAEQTGAIRHDSSLHAPDLDFCLHAAGLHPSAEEYKLMAPCLYEPACSPHLAGRMKKARGAPTSPRFRRSRPASIGLISTRRATASMNPVSARRLCWAAPDRARPSAPRS